MSLRIETLAGPLRTLKPPRPSQLRSNHTLPPPPTPKSSRVQRYLPRLQDLSKRTGVPLSSLAVSFLVLHELTAVLPVIGFYFLFSSLGTGLGIIEWLNRTTVNGTEEEGKGEGGWQGVVKGWYDEGQGKVGRVGRRYGLWQDDPVMESEGLSTGTSRAGEGVANAVAAYVVVKVWPITPLSVAILTAGIAPSEDRSLTRRSTNIREMGPGTHTEFGDEMDTEKRCINYPHA